MAQGGQPGYATQPTGSAAPASSAPAANPLGAILSNPELIQQIVTGALAGGAAQMGGLTGGELGPVQSGIKMKAKQVAPGMKPVGQLMSAKLGQGQHAQAPLQLAAGGCYAIVGFGGAGVFRYQLNMLSVAPPGGQAQVLAQSPDTASDPVIGPNGQCISVPTPMAVTVDMYVVMGQGMVGAQVYKK